LRASREKTKKGKACRGITRLLESQMWRGLKPAPHFLNTK